MNFLKGFNKDLRSILTGNIGILFTTWILLNFGHSMVGRFNGIYFSALGASDVVLGLMNAITFGMMALLQIPGGYLADTYGRRRVITTFTLVMALSTLIFAIAPSWQWIIVGLVISNAALLYQPALFSIIMDSLPKNRRAEGFAITNISMIPGIFGPIVGGLLIYMYGTVPGMRIAYFILFALSVASALIRFKLKETMKIKKKKRMKFVESFKILKSIKTRAKGLLLVNMLFSSAGGMVGYFIVKYAYGYTSPLIYGIAMGLITVLMVVVSIPAGRRADLYGKEKFFILGLFLSSISIFIFIIPSVIALFSYAILIGISNAIFQPSNSGLIADYVDSENRGRYMGVSLFLSYISAMIFSAIGGYLYHINPTILFLLSGILYSLAGIFAILIFIKFKE
jgi:DHA1 family tetracycline resistance protein-like MFS transporter